MERELFLEQSVVQAQARERIARQEESAARDRLSEAEWATTFWHDLSSELNKGNYAQVKQATHKATGMQVAIKIYDKFKLSANAQIKKSVQREIKLLSILSNTDRDARGTAMMEDFG